MDHWHNTRKYEILYSPEYQSVKKLSPLLHKPFLTVKNLHPIIEDLTYRKINDWDSKNLISGNRENKQSGWRRFSFVDIVKFRIIMDLRTFGFPIDKIKVILEHACNSSVTLVKCISNEKGKKGEKKRFKFLELEHAILACLNGRKVLLLVNEAEKEKTVFATELEAVQHYFTLCQASYPVVILPFFGYVKRMMKSLTKTDISISAGSTIQALLNNRLTTKERKILEILRNQNYEEISFSKSDGTNIVVRAKSRKRGSFTDEDIKEAINDRDYQKVTVSTVGGKKISLVREETIKI